LNFASAATNAAIWASVILLDVSIMSGLAQVCLGAAGSAAFTEGVWDQALVTAVTAMKIGARYFMLFTWFKGVL
jgi:hypothetical protein